MHIPPRKEVDSTTEQSEKQSWRAEMRRRLRTVTARLQREAATAAARHLLAIPPLASVQSVMLYASLPSEIGTDTLFHGLRDRQVAVAYPIMHLTQRRMDLHVVNALGDLVPNVLGIREPVPQPQTRMDPATLSAVIVPGLAFDRAGRRLGRGKGYYDRFLLALPPHVWRIGFCYALQEIEKVPTNELDALMDWVVTEKGVLCCVPSAPERTFQSVSYPESDEAQRLSPVSPGHPVPEQG
jgi:5-formyltetrahydrofolate cyclo-ligase